VLIGTSLPQAAAVTDICDTKIDKGH